LLTSSNGDSTGLPEPLVRVSAEVRRKIDEDVVALSQSMRGMLERIEKIAAVNQSFASNPVSHDNDGDEHRPLEISTALNRPAAAESKPPLRLQTWANGA